MDFDPAKKSELLKHFRDIIQKQRGTLAKLHYKKAAKKVNKTCNEVRKKLVAEINDSKIKSQNKLESILLVHYASYVVMIESRNRYWGYDKIQLARRMGELWEPLMIKCFETPSKKLKIIEHTDFQKMIVQMEENILSQIGDKCDDVSNLISMIKSMGISLKLDLHIIQNEKIYHIDFKNSFNSNEKGNTNRLLLVARILKVSGIINNCLMLVRAAKDENNNYLKRISDSKNWDVHCASEAYKAIEGITGFKIGSWIAKNVDWEKDLDSATVRFFKNNNLIDVITW